MIAVNLEKVSYQESLAYQHKLWAARVQKKIDDIILLLEHYPVITLGRSSRDDELLVSEDELVKGRIEIHRVNRGGKITCHYPGQLIGYPIIDLRNHGRDIQAYVHNLEETIIRTLSDFGVRAERLNGMRGVWVNDDKIAYIGVAVKEWVATHGFAVNIKENWDYSTYFVPCGIKDKGTTFLETHSGSPRELDMEKIKIAVLKHFSKVFGVLISRYVSKIEFDNEFMTS